MKVTVSKGWVTLEGEVDWEYQNEDAERVAWSVPGVTEVEHHMTITL